MRPRSKAADRKTSLLREQGSLHPHPHQVSDLAFVQTDFFDPRDLVQVKYEMLRRVHTEGRTVSEATTAFALSRPTYYKADHDFAESGVVGLLPRKRGPRGPHKLTSEAMALIERELAKDDDLQAADLANLLEAALGYAIHPRTIERTLKRSKKKRR